MRGPFDSRPYEQTGYFPDAPVADVEPGLYGVDALSSDDFRAHVLTDQPGRGPGTRLALCGASHRKWRPVEEFARPEVFTPCADCRARSAS